MSPFEYAGGSISIAVGNAAMAPVDEIMRAVSNFASRPSWFARVRSASLAAFRSSRVLVALTSSALLACGNPQEEVRASAADGSPNILLVSIDTLRSDALSPYRWPSGLRRTLGKRVY
jgi:hypothetical protein